MIRRKVGRQNDRVVSAESLSRGLQIVVDLPCNKVLDRLYVGSLETLAPYYLTLFNIRQIISVCDCGEGNEELVHTALHNPGTGESIPMLQYYVGDLAKSQIGLHFDSCALFIHYGRLHERNVLIHCNQGVSRSPAIVTAYLMCIADLHLIDLARQRGRPSIRCELRCIRCCACQSTTIAANWCHQNIMDCLLVRPLACGTTGLSSDLKFRLAFIQLFHDRILQALKVMRSKICLNPSFISQLLDFQQNWASKVWSNIQYELGDWWKARLDRSRLLRYSQRFKDRGLTLQELPEIQRYLNPDE